ncbi:L,D-transpeptidase family protein [Prosthecobacter sp.]|uniref:L,D-transpeptidase family protein n=1 Tax=Prosthecobacter sp. TaxID=1965333 RepID=UPI0037847755
MLGACVFPPLVGVGICWGIMQILKNHEMFRLDVVTLPTATVSKVRQGKLSGTSAEIRASLPVDASFDPVRSLPVPPNAEKTALRRAAEAPKVKPFIATELSRGDAGGGTARKSDKPSPAIAFKTPAWRPILDPITDHWTRLMPRTAALPQAYQAVLNDDAAHLAKIIAMGISPNEMTLGGDTPLCAAVRMGRADCVNVLALSGVNLNQPAHEKQPPIAIASLRRNTPVLQALLDFGVDPNTRFNTPIHKQVIDRCTIKDLRNAMESDRGITPMICCAARGDVEGAVTLMRAGGRPGMGTTRYHRYPINFAATQGYLFLMRVLLGRDPESEPDTLVTVDLSSQRAWVTKQGRIINHTMVSTGREGYGTPAGRYVITDKHTSHVSTLYHVAMPWFMRLNCGAIGLHSGYVTGQPASHGCIRLPYEKAKQFFSQVRVGDEVEIVY